MERIPLRSLVLNRRRDESVIFYDDDGRIVGRVTVIQCRGDRAKLKLDFPDRVKLLRGELVLTAFRSQAERSVLCGDDVLRPESMAAR